MGWFTKKIKRTELGKVLENSVRFNPENWHFSDNGVAYHSTGLMITATWSTFSGDCYLGVYSSNGKNLELQEQDLITQDDMEAIGRAVVDLRVFRKKQLIRPSIINDVIWQVEEFDNKPPAKAKKRAS